MIDAIHDLLDEPRVLHAMAEGAGLKPSHPKRAVQWAWFERKCPHAMMEALKNAPAPLILTDPTEALCRSILSRFHNTVAQSENLNAVSSDAARRLVDDGLALLREWNEPVAETVLTLLPMVIAVDVSSGRAGGATMSDLPAVIWIRPGDRWKAEDAAESFLHEAVHQSLFLHDAVYGIFEEHAFVNAPMVPSAIRLIYPSNQEPIRTFWAALHALCVAEWLSAWFGSRNSAMAEKFDKARTVARPHLIEHAHLLTPLGRQLLRAAL